MERERNRGFCNIDRPVLELLAINYSNHYCWKRIEIRVREGRKEEVEKTKGKEKRKGKGRRERI